MGGGGGGERGEISIAQKFKGKYNAELPFPEGLFGGGGWGQNQKTLGV